MSKEPNHIWRPVVIIAGGLTLWGLLLGIGAFLALADDFSGTDSRKLGVVAITTGLFLALWGSVLWIRHRKVRKRPSDQQHPTV